MKILVDKTKLELIQYFIKQDRNEEASNILIEMLQPKGLLIKETAEDCDLLNEIEALKARTSALENKRPEYVPPPVYGPIHWTCEKCGQTIQGSQLHDCPGPYVKKGINQAI